MAASAPGRTVRTLRVTGVVQGVGYRPFVYALAHELGLSGWVLNDSHGVLVRAAGPAAALGRLQTELATRAPVLARVDAVHVEPHDGTDDESSTFEIRESRDLGQARTFVAPDSHVCDDCLAEVRDSADRRFRYPFTNCTNCGPRYSIVTSLPYDRASTTMAAFTMCAACRSEYDDPADRRYHAQPNACHDCGPQLSLVDRERRVVATRDTALREAAAALAEGRIVAVKSIGGFHLAVDATAAESVAALRRGKRRDAKPFAVLVGDLDAARRLAEVSDVEAALLQGPSRPIVLLRKRAGVLPEAVAPRNPSLGIMLPSAPLHHLLLGDSGCDALVMTSGNLSGHPIAYRNAEAEEQLTRIADLVLLNDRDIHQRVDDSVVRSSELATGESFLTFLRRGRGCAPYAIPVTHLPEPTVGLGAELKTSVALGVRDHVFVGQHVGDVKSDENLAFHQASAEHLQRLYDTKAERLACDLHPRFRTHRLALESGAEHVTTVQHHHAHMASCLAENQVTGTAVGVVLDGAGYGTDGTIWGAEVLVGDTASVERVAHLRPVPLLGGDVAVREPVRTGLAMALAAFGDHERAVQAFPALGAFDDRERHVLQTMYRRGLNSPPASSMGRFFDGVAALLGVCLQAEYEAQGPIELEGLLGRDLAPTVGYSFELEEHDGVVVASPDALVRELAADLARGVELTVLSRRVHSGVVDLVRDLAVSACREAGTDQVVLSGGVFLNEFLTVNCVTALRDAGLRVFHHHLVPPNDGGIALGQVVVAAARRGEDRTL